MKAHIMILIAIIAVAGCTVQNAPEGNNDNAPSQVIDWKNTEFTDVSSDETFKISDFEGQPVLVEVFAVWCPKCAKQQVTLQEFKAENEDVVIVSIDADPNEDVEQVLGRVNDKEYDWYFAVSPADTTQSLVNEFGTTIVNPPSGPMLLICPNQEARLLPSGHKSVGDLQEEIAGGCL